MFALHNDRILEISQEINDLSRAIWTSTAHKYELRNQIDLLSDELTILLHEAADETATHIHYHVTYNHNTDHYEVTDQHRTVYASFKHKVDAEWAELELIAPDVYPPLRDLCIRHKDQSNLVHRALKAGHMLHRGLVSPNGSPLSYDVKSTFDIGCIYRATLSTNGHGWTCTIHDNRRAKAIGQPCPDQRAPDLGKGRRCKHLIAAYIAHTNPDLLQQRAEPVATGSAVQKDFTSLAEHPNSTTQPETSQAHDQGGQP